MIGKKLKAICEAHGCVHSRTSGDYCVMTKPGIARPAVFPMKRDLKEDIVLGVGRTIGINRKQFETPKPKAVLSLIDAVVELPCGARLELNGDEWIAQASDFENVAVPALARIGRILARYGLHRPFLESPFQTVLAVFRHTAYR